MATLTNEKIYTTVHKLLREADQAREYYIPRAERNKWQYLNEYADDTSILTGHSNFKIPKTQKSIISQTAIQIEQRPRIRLFPRENAQDSEIFMTRKALNTIALAMDEGRMGEEVPDDNPFSEVPVEEGGFEFGLLDANPECNAFPVSEQFLERVAVLFQPDPETGFALLRPGDVFTINDKLTSEVLQNNIDTLWDEGDNDLWLMEALTNNNILGWQPSLYQWNTELMRDEVVAVHVKNAWIDPNMSSVETGDYVIIREEMSKETAVEKYPMAAGKIKEATKGHNSGFLDDGLISESDNPEQYTTYERAMISVWTCWIRNSRFDMSVDDAIEYGKVVIDGDSMFIADEKGQKTAEKTSPTSKNWPKRRGVLQVQIVADQVVYKEELEHWDIPVIWQKNIPEPYRPYGIGEPDALEWIDRLINKLSSILFDHFLYYRSFTEIYPMEVWDSLTQNDGLEEIHAHPGKQYAIDDAAYQKYMNVLAHGHGFAVKPPPMPESAFQYLQFLLKLHDDISGNTEALQGRLPAAGTSGRALETLQSAAKGVVGFKSIQTEHALRRLTRLRVHATTKWLPLFMWKKWNDQYPIEVLEAVRKRAKNMEWEVSVEVVSGGGQVREQLDNKIRQDVQLGLVDPQTAAQELGYDAGAVPAAQSQGQQVNG